MADYACGNSFGIMIEHSATAESEQLPCHVPADVVPTVSKRSLRTTHTDIAPSEDGESSPGGPGASRFRQGLASALVIREANAARNVWNVILALLLIYTGTYFPFHLCFVEFHMVTEIHPSASFIMWDYIIDGLFWFDLVINFSFTYNNHLGVEVTCLKKIVKHYLLTYFFLNFVACLPQTAIAPVITWFATRDDASSGEPTSVHQVVRIVRLQRITRLARITRLGRLAKVVSFLSECNLWRRMRGRRSIRIMNSVIGLFWSVHLMACGWYLCAALHNDSEETWVARRAVNAAGTHSLLERGPGEQWLHSMYFVLTVFTTVGFGDMSAMTSGEIFYVNLTMVVGAVVNSIIFSEIINIVTALDSRQALLAERRQLVVAFSKHTELGPNMSRSLCDWVNNRQASDDHKYDRLEVKRLLTSGQLPQELMRKLPDCVYNGRLQRNKFLTVCLSHSAELPPRLAVLLALATNRRFYVAGEIVYQLHDHPFSLFLVDINTGEALQKRFEGDDVSLALATREPSVFAHVGRATAKGGVDGAPLVDGGIQSKIRGMFAEMGAQNDAKPGANGDDDESGPAAVKKTAMAKGISSAVSAKLNSPRTLLWDPQRTLTGFGSISKVHPAQLERTAKAKIDPAQQLYPYRLIVPGNFFGEVEVLSNVARESTVRCESTFGSVLSLQKQDLFAVIEDFPHFGNAWRAAGQRRELVRLQRRAQLTRSKVNYKALAVVPIQRYFRQKWGFRAPKPSWSRSTASAPASPMTPSASPSSAPLLARTAPARMNQAGVSNGRGGQAEAFGAPALVRSSAAPSAGGDAAASAEVQQLLVSGLADIRKELALLRQEINGPPERDVYSLSRTAVYANRWRRRAAGSGRTASPAGSIASAPAEQPAARREITALPMDAAEQPAAWRESTALPTEVAPPRGAAFTPPPATPPPPLELEEDQPTDSGGQDTFPCNSPE